MTKFCQLTIKVENKGEISPYFAYNENTTFEDLLEFIAYYYPSINICPCSQFKGQYEKSDELIDIDNNWLVMPCISKFYFFKIENRKECQCNQQFKEYYRKNQRNIL